MKYLEPSYSNIQLRTSYRWEEETLLEPLDSGAEFKYGVDDRAREPLPPSMSNPDGGSPLQPYPTLADLPTLIANDGVGFAYGAQFAEALVEDADDLTFGAFGNSNESVPLITGADEFSPAAWASEGGNVYSQTVSGPGGANIFLRLFEQDNADIYTLSASAACAPGQYFVDDMTSTTPKFYMQAFDSSDPSTKTYEFTARRYAVRLTGEGVYIANIATRRAAANDGSLITDGEATLSEVSAEDGNKHNFLLAYGDADNLLAQGGYFGTDTSGLLEAHMTSTAKSLRVRNAVMRLETYSQTVSAFDHHVTGGGTYDLVETVDCEAINTGGGFSGTDAMLLRHIRPITRNTQNAFGVSCDTVIVKPTDVSTQAGGRFIMCEVPDISFAIEGDGEEYGICYRSNFANQQIRFTQPGVTISIDKMKFGSPTYQDFSVLQAEYGDIVIGDMQFDCTNILTFAILGRGANDATLSTPGVYRFSSGNFSLELNGVNYPDLDAMQAAGYFANATIGPIDFGL